MEATKCLREEHQVILRVLDCFEVVLRRSDESGATAREDYEPFVDFFRGFADKCHHCKEEDRLFPVLEKLGVPREGGPIGVMLEEHRQGRSHVGAIAENLGPADAGDKEAVQAVLEHGKAFLELLRRHIDKEDRILFGMADQVTQGEALAGLLQAYRDAESEPDYRDTYGRCRKIADRLAETWGRS